MEESDILNPFGYGKASKVIDENRKPAEWWWDYLDMNEDVAENEFYILFEDGHYERKLLERLHDDDDHLYKNHDGQAAAGKNPEDAVIGASETQP